MDNTQGLLFDAEEMSRIEKDSLWNELPEPVTVLGMTFGSDEERRAYFREELRKKLPELRKIEGFPLGKDDDIINLSDPPYYTACPNPWLNDFIAEWEKEKVQLMQENKRTADFDVKEPYASDVSEGKTNPVYTAHTYHTKVPHPAIMRYILHYTQPGDIVFDGFAGTGMTGVAAQACGDSQNIYSAKIANEWKTMYGSTPKWGVRHAICGDLSPYAADMSFCYNTPLDTNLLLSEMTRITKELNEECGWLYQTLDEKGKPTGTINCVVWSDVFVCPSCGKEYVFWDASIDYENKCIKDDFNCPHCNSIQTKKSSKVAMETVYDEALKETIQKVKSVPVIIAYSVGKKRFEKRPDDFDLELIRKIDALEITDFFPIDELPEGYNTEQPKRSRNIFHVHQFFTKRNLFVLARLFSKIEASPIADKLRFIFTGMINRSTVMNRVHVSNYFYGGGGWNAGHLKGTLYVPNAPVETSVLEQISDKVSALTRAAEFLPKKIDNLQYVGSADNLTIGDNSVDYIFVDPPFGANINYSELNFLPEPWLKVVTNNHHEAIENSGQNKSADFYRDMMVRCFKEFYRILKPGKWITVEFSNTSSAVWNSIQMAITSAGLVIANVSALDKKQGGIRSITTTTAVRQDLIISCYKPSESLVNRINENNKDETVWSFINEHLSHLPVHIERDNTTTAIVERSSKILYDRLVSYYVQKGLVVPIDATDFQKGLKEYFIERDEMYFTVPQAAEYAEKRKHTTGVEPLGLIVSDEANGIEWLKLRLKEPKTYQQISPEWMQTVKGVKKGDILPELKDILEQNFIEDELGYWHVPNYEKQIDLEKMRHKTLMREFNIIKELAQKPRARIKDVRTEALREGFKQCFKDKDFKTIILIGDKIPQNILTEDDQLLQYYDIAQMRS